MCSDYTTTLPKSGSSVVLLLSGGVDSAALAALLKTQGCEVLPLHIDYGQRAARSEWRAVKEVCRQLCIPNPVSIDMSSIRGLLKSQLLRVKRRKSETNASFAADFLPHRNAFLTSVAAIYAADRGASHVVLGIIGGAEAHYPDTSVAFLEKLRALFKIDPKVVISAPFAGIAKRHVVKVAKQCGLNLSATFSCNAQDGRHCGRCPSCLERRSVIGRSK